MHDARESRARTLTVAATVCLACSVLVSVTAVLLRPIQEENRERERQQRILAIVEREPSLAEMLAGLDAPAVEARIVELASGTYADWIDPAELDERAAALDPLQSVEIPPERDLAGIERRAKLATVYQVESEGRIALVILPVHGQGYVSTLRGFIALSPDGRTVAAVTFYEHEETPGLGAEIDDPDWLAQWAGKRVRDPSGEVLLGVGPEELDPASPLAPYQVDGISGATKTGDGVTALLRYWLGPDGFGPFLESLANREGATDA